MITIKKILDEIERIKKDQDKILDRKCVGQYTCDVIFIDTNEEYCVTKLFDEKKSCFDFYFAGCYLIPGKITTLREIYINALECNIRNQLLNYYKNPKGIELKYKELFKDFLPELYDYIIKDQGFVL